MQSGKYGILGWEVVTGMYADWRRIVASGPCRSSPRAPRSSTPDARRWPHMRELAPYGKLFELHGDEFVIAYTRKLDSIGRAVIRDRLTAIHRAEPRPLALLCFEPAGEPRHRRTFASWWKQQTGQKVPEFEPT